MVNSRRRKLIQTVFVILSIVVLAILAFNQIKYDKANDVISNISINSKDNKLVVSWSLHHNSKISEIIIGIKDANENILDTYSLKSNVNLIEIDNLGLNNTYIILVSGLYENGSYQDFYEEKYFFYNTEFFPNLPVVNIKTNSGEDPSASYMDAPDGLWGSTSYDNEYLKATMTYDGFDSKLESKLKIRIRGNTSSLDDKKPYKLVLDDPLDLTNSGTKYVHSEWILLNTGGTLNNYLGETIANAIGVEWVAHGIYVNLILNGDYKGIYTLCEPVSQSASRGLVDKDGVIFEYDTYFWNANGIYFKLIDGFDQMGYTFKYPSIKSPNDKLIYEVCDYMQTFVSLAFENDESAWNYADIDNFVSYIIAKDLMANGDAGGSNIYYYIEDFDSNDLSKRKVKLGPLWDFNYIANAYMEDEYTFNTYSSQHNNGYLHFVDNYEFIYCYWDKWEYISDDVLDKIYASLDDLLINQGKAINQSRYLNSLRWADGSYQTIENEVSIAKEWLAKQVDFLNSEMENYKQCIE